MLKLSLNNYLFLHCVLTSAVKHPQLHNSHRPITLRPGKQTSIYLLQVTDYETMQLNACLYTPYITIRMYILTSAKVPCIEAVYHVDSILLSDNDASPPPIRAGAGRYNPL